jgi:hypothetical protein
MKLVKINNLEYEVSVDGFTKHINYYKDFNIDLMDLSFVDVIKFPKPKRIPNAFVERSILPKISSILLIGYGAEDYITPLNNMKSDLLDVGNNVSKAANYIQTEAINVYRINKQYDCVLIGVGSIEMCEKGYFIQTIKNCFRVSPMVITSLRTENFKGIDNSDGGTITYKTNVGTYKLNEGNNYIYSPDNFEEFCSNFSRVEMLAKDADSDLLKNRRDSHLRVAIYK